VELTHDGIREFAAKALGLPLGCVRAFVFDDFVCVEYAGHLSVEACAVGYDAISERLPDGYTLTVEARLH
jgi:hypothetical protein